LFFEFFKKMLKNSSSLISLNSVIFYLYNTTEHYLIQQKDNTTKDTTKEALFRF